MRAVDLIYRKRQGQALEPREIEWLIADYVKGRIPDYQISALLMAIYFKGLTGDELTALTRAMMFSGETYDWSDIPGVKADKHSTGGVGDKVSLILSPLAAACGLVVPMVSGRGLGHTGGTLDKLESIPGFSVNITPAKARKQLAKIGMAMWGQSEKFVPADKMLYALRDVTATVESKPLITASIMSKKLGEGCEVLVLDIKVGNGAFMDNLPDARELAKLMIKLGDSMNRKVSAVLTDMNQPLGDAVGNANEVIESIDCLRGGGPADLKAVTFELTGRMLMLGGLAKDRKAAFAMMQQAIDSGRALEKFRQLVEAQGGDPRVIDKPSLLPRARKEAVIAAPAGGYVTAFNTRAIGNGASILGAGRPTKEASIDHGVSLHCHVQLGQTVAKGDPIYTVRYNKESAWESARPVLNKSFNVAAEPVKPPKLIKQII